MLEPAPVAEILRRARRRRQRRHAAGFVAGAGALVLTSTTVVTLARGDGGTKVESNVASQGSGAGAVPPTFGDDVAPAPTTTTPLLHLGLDLPDAVVRNAHATVAPDQSSVTITPYSYQRFRADPNDLNSPHVDITTVGPSARDRDGRPGFQGRGHGAGRARRGSSCRRRRSTRST